ncbi:MAG: hypothetical protein CBC38_01520 [Gammaproteobacteria bacterium TMED78]|nr:MAG: hypothetical protein CBC38_01520 [Gammaproteobacteria bacterium TMED78]|tara:strand:- start:12644 stop:14419 length:1776 start_codon:yes stop_codon:yes gene_type:complete
MSILIQIRDLQNDWIEFRDPVEVYLANSIEEVKDTIRKAEKKSLVDHLWVVGFLSYEASSAFDETYKTFSPSSNFPLAWFAVFNEYNSIPNPYLVDLAIGSSLNWVSEINKESYVKNIKYIQNLIREGHTYQVNYSYRLKSSFDNFFNCSRALFSQMIHNQPFGYGAYIETSDFSILSASNELFFKKYGNEVICRPMKGTISRGYDLKSDENNAKWLKESEKNKAENLMITDMVRNDLGKFSNSGSVKVDSLFEIEKYPTLWQMISSVKANSSDSSLSILSSLFPAASITGAPKHRTMEIISNLEQSAREIYTGSIGFIRPDGSSQFNVAIRTAWFNNITKEAKYAVGGGIVIDSSPEEEWQECITKSKIIKKNIDNFELLETIKWELSEDFSFLQDHLGRLKRTATFFGINFNYEKIIEKLNESIEIYNAKKSNRHPLIVRLLLNKYGSPRVEISKLVELPDPYNVLVSNEPLDVREDVFVLNKTTNRKVYDYALTSAKRKVTDIHDVIILNNNLELTESTIANLFIEFKGRLLTPPIESGLLPGIYRQYLLDIGRAEEEILDLDILNSSDKIFLANSVRGIWQINIIDY